MSLSVRGLHKRYGDVVAVNGLDLEVAAGECFGLLGPNGAGKTTTIEICEGLLQPDAGEVHVLGLQWATHERELRQRLGVQLQETQLAEKLTVEETVRLFRSFFARGPSVDRVIDLVQLGEKRGARVGKLSGGQKQRLAIACAVVGEPDLLFLDEPTTGLDPQSRRQLWDLIVDYKRKGATVVLTTHYMDEAQMLCDRVAIVDHGRVIALGTPRDLIASLGAEHVVRLSIEGAAPPSDATFTRLPGLMGMNIMGASIWGLGFAIVDSRRRKLLKRFVATPMSRVEYLLSFVLSRLVLLVLEMAVILGFGALALGVPVRGSLLLVVVVGVVSATAFGAMGLLVASRVRTTEGVSGLANLAMIPMWVLSGVFFSSENFPKAVQPLIQVMPLTATNDAFRAIMLRGAGFATVGGDLLILAVWTLVCGILALKIFRWQ